MDDGFSTMLRVGNDLLFKSDNIISMLKNNQIITIKSQQVTSLFSLCYLSPSSHHQPMSPAEVSPLIFAASFSLQRTSTPC